MTDKKLTYKEIIKALESEIHLAEYVDNDYCSNVKLEIIKSALDLITRRQAENENLKVKLQSMRGAANSLKMHYEEAQAEIERLNKVYQANQQLINALNKSYFLAKTEAVKDFAERLKEKSGKMEMVCSGALVQRDYTISEKTLDTLAKEMVGESNSDE